MAREQARSGGETPAADLRPGPATPSDNHQPAPAPLPSVAARPRWRWLVLGLAAAVGVVVLAVVGIPWLDRYLHHVSTDDAFVNGHLTLVSARITGVVDQVLVDDNDYVEARQVLARLDPAPYRLAVEEKRAALARAKLATDQQVAAL